MSEWTPKRLWAVLDAKGKMDSVHMSSREARRRAAMLVADKPEDADKIVICRCVVMPDFEISNG